MKLSVFGLGYTGMVTAACLADRGHRVVGVDIAVEKVDLLNAGRSPLLEPGLEPLIKNAVAQGSLRATTVAEEAVRESDMALVCVGTPSGRDGAFDGGHLFQVVDQIGAALRERATPFTLGVRSTIPPGTMRQKLIPRLEAATGRPVGSGYDVFFHPEFLREGTAIADFRHPSRIIVGERLPGSAGCVMDLYAGWIEAPRLACALEVVETVKYCDNLFHAVKITFANEVGQFCRSHEVDSAEVMRLFCADTTLNISTKYLAPGFAFGGSCLPKDLRAFLAAAGQKGLTLPMLGNILASNEHQVQRATELVLSAPGQTIGLHGLTFKPGTDDLRESPWLELAARVIAAGRRVLIHDRLLRSAHLTGGNLAHLAAKLPDWQRLLVAEVDELAACDVIVVGHRFNEDAIPGWLHDGRPVVDLTGAGSETQRALGLV